MTQTFDRAADDLGNIVSLEHVNVCVPDQSLATSFYISALGLTRDTYMMTGVDNMWANIGASQFHLPSRGTQVLRELPDWSCRGLTLLPHVLNRLQAC